MNREEERESTPRHRLEPPERHPLASLSPFVVPIGIVGIVMLVPIIAILSDRIPGAGLLAVAFMAILAYHIRRVYEARLRYGAQVSKDEITELKRKFAEMEGRMATLQEIVIGDYDTKRAIERVQAASRSLSPSLETPVRPQEEIRSQDS